MSRVIVRVRLGVCTTHARYLSLLIAISNKTFAEGVTSSKTMSLERCGFKNPVRVRVRVRVKVRVS